MIVKERYGVRDDGNVVIETSTYVPTTPDHPRAVTIEGEEGYWVRVMVGNALPTVSAKEVTRQRFEEAKEELAFRTQAIQEELEQRREQRQQEIDAKKQQITAELRKLGLSTDTVAAIVNQVQE